MRTQTWIASGAMTTLALGLAGCNTTPVALDDQATAPVGATTTINVLANDTDPDADPLYVKRAWGSTKGTVVINSDNSISYTANSGASGTDVFNYRIKDRKGAADKAVVLVNIEQPVAVVEQPTPVILSTPEPIYVETKPAPPPPPPVVVVPPPQTYVVTPPPSPLVDAMLVTLYTVDDDKNRDEGVRVVVRRGNEILAEKSAGHGELWGNNTNRSFELNLDPDVPLNSVGQLSVDIIKSATGSGSGGGWVFYPEVLGRLHNGKLIALFDNTKNIKLGDGEARDITITIPNP